MRFNALAGLSMGAFIALAASPSFAATTLEHRFQFSPDRFSLHSEASATVVEVSGATREFEAGRPDLPWIGESIDLPFGMRVTQVEVVAIETASLAERVRVPSAIRPRPGLGAIERTAPDPEIFGRAGFQPASPVKIGAQGWQRGQNHATLEVCPVRWDAASGRLERVASMSVRLTLEPTSERPVPRERIVPEWESQPMVAGPSRLAPESEVVKGRPQPFKATQIPSVLGSPVAYVIVTNDAMASEFQRLADWKTQSGVPAVVRTLTFIRQQYPNAADDAERVRLFIRDAYSRWGTKWVLLGGDTDVIPTRMTSTTYFGGEEIACDLYFSCLDGNWNADGDAYFGEGYHGVDDPGDQCDLMPEVWVGRAPVTSASTAQLFVDKTFTYERTSPGNYENTALFFAEVLFPQPWNPGDYISLDGGTLAEEVLPFVRAQPAVHYARMYQNWDNVVWEPGVLPESRQAVLDSLNRGYNLTCHIGHGYRNVMSVADGNLENANVMTLTNGNKLTNLYSTNCTSNAIDFPCIGEAFLLAPNGGAVTNIGSSRYDFPATGRYYQQEYFKLVYRDSITAIGEAQGRQKLPFVGSSNNDGINRWTQMTLLLLGDPELRIYTSLPRVLSVTNAASVPLSDTALTVHVQVGATPLANARVTAYKVGDDYRTGVTNASGNLVLPFRPDGIGSFTLTVTAFNARPYQATVNITPAGAAVLSDLAPVLDDDNLSGTHGNSNATLDAGETVDIRIPVKNIGGATASSVNGVLSTTDGLITIPTPNVIYGSISAGATVNPSTGFRIALPYTLPDQREVPLKLTLTATGGLTNVENLQLLVLAPELLHLSHTVSDAGGNSNQRPDSAETIQYTVRLRNRGTGSTSLVTGKLRNLSGAIVTDSTASWGSFTAGEEKSADSFTFSLNSSNAKLELHVFNEYGEVLVQKLDMSYPDAPTGLYATGFTTTVDLVWDKNEALDLRGYNIYRALALGGPYAKVNAIPTDRTAYFLDNNLASLSTYYYKVTAVDSSGNESAFSDPAPGSTTPGYHSIFPIPMGSNTSAHVAIDHIYSQYPLDIASSAGVIYVWHPDGTAPVDADGAGSTHGDFTTLGNRYEAGPSIADLDGDHNKDIIGVTWNPDVYGPANPRLYVFDQNGTPRPGFPVVTYDPVWSSVAVGDLNNDGVKEMVFASNGNKIYAYRANGTEWRDGDSNPATTGVFKILGDCCNYGTPALVDLDQNGVLDIVFGSFDKKLYAWRPDGTNLPGFPVNLNGFCNSSVAIGYLDGSNDTELDIVVATGDYGHTFPKDSLFVIRANGQRKPGWPIPIEGSYSSRPPSVALGDMNNDGYVDVVFAQTNGLMTVRDRNGAPIAPLDGFRYSPLTSASAECSPIIADINGDGKNDILMGDDTRQLQGMNGNGGLLPGFPIVLPAEAKGTPAVCDCDGDGLTEIVTTSLDGNVFVWDYDQPFSPTLSPPWPQFHHDAARTGVLGNPLYVDAPPQPGGPAPLKVALAPALPNPAGTSTRITYAVPADREGQSLELSVYDLNGREVRTLVTGDAHGGRFSAVWNLRDRAGARVQAGVYFAQLKIGEQRASQKLIVVH